jgi:hypothetical protein
MGFPIPASIDQPQTKNIGRQAAFTESMRSFKASLNFTQDNSVYP